MLDIEIVLRSSLQFLPQIVFASMNVCIPSASYAQDISTNECKSSYQISVTIVKLQQKLEHEEMFLKKFQISNFVQIFLHGFRDVTLGQTGTQTEATVVRTSDFTMAEEVPAVN